MAGAASASNERSPRGTIASRTRSDVAAPVSLRGAATAFVAVLFTIGGWQQMNRVAGEIRDPQRTIPRGLRIGIGIVMSLAAREVIVGTLGTLYGMDPKAGSEGLQAALRHDLTPGGAVALLVFFAFAMQCLSTVAVVRRETGGWKWPAIQFAYMGLLAYSGAFIANRLVTLFLG